MLAWNTYKTKIDYRSIEWLTKHIEKLAVQYFCGPWTEHLHVILYKSDTQTMSMKFKIITVGLYTGKGEEFVT